MTGENYPYPRKEGEFPSLPKVIMDLFVVVLLLSKVYLLMYIFVTKEGLGAPDRGSPPLRNLILLDFVRQLFRIA